MSEERKDINSSTPKGFRLGFGIFMVLFYVAIGIVFILNLFKSNFEGLFIALGIILIIYGFWRGFRLIRGWK